MESNISIVIVTWNNEKDISECLESVFNQSYNNFQVILVDNNSTDNTVSIVSEKFPKVTVLKQDSNKYLAPANNIGIRYAIGNFNSEYVLVLNPDTKVESNLLEVLHKTISKDERIGAVGPKVNFYKNQNDGLINSVGLIFDGFNKAYDIGYMEEDKGQFDQEREVFGVTGTCILYRVKMLKEIGLYWERIKLYLDEIELFIRAQKKGWKVLYTPKTTVWHKYMQSVDKNKLYKIERDKRKVWLWIALRHYPLKRKLAMLKKYLFN